MVKADVAASGRNTIPTYALEIYADTIEAISILARPIIGQLVELCQKRAVCCRTHAKF